MAESSRTVDSPFGLIEVCEFPSRTFASVWCEKRQRAVFASGSEDAILLVSVAADSDEEPHTHLIPWRAPAPAALCFDPTARWLACCVLADRDSEDSRSRLRLISVADFVGVDDDEDPEDPSAKLEAREIPLPLETGKVPTAAAWWQADARHPVVVVGDQTGQLLFLSLTALKAVGKSYIVGRVCELAVCANDDLDTVDLLITASKNRQWRLILEKKPPKGKSSSTDKKRSNLLGDASKRIENIKKKVANMKADMELMQFDRVVRDFLSDKTSGDDRQSSDVLEKFSNYIKDNNPSPVYLFASQEADADVVETVKCRLLVSQQNTSGYSFISTLNSSTGVFNLYCNLEFSDPVMSYKIEDLPSDVCKILWQKILIYSFGTNSVKIHSSHLSLTQNDNRHTVIWEDSLNDGEYLIDACAINGHRKYPAYTKQWTGTVKVENLALPRFDLGSCLIITNKKIYILKTSQDPCEWLVKKVIEGQSGVERIAAALAIQLPDLLLGAADVLLAKKSINRALSIYRLAKIPSDEILMRLGASGLYSQMLSNDLHPQSCSSANVYCVARILSAIIHNKQQMISLLNFVQNDVVFDVIVYISLCADLGLWNVIETVSFLKGMVWLGFESLVCRLKSPCRGLLSTLLNRFYTPFIIKESGLAFLKFIDQYCETFDISLLKRLCVWLCPLQDCFRVLFKSLCTSQLNSHLSGMRRLIRTFFGVVSTLNSRISSREELLSLPNLKYKKSLLNPVILQESENFDHFKPIISCGHTHWGIVCGGKIIFMRTNGATNVINIDLDFMGKALGVSCGREHSLILTENGVYSLGDNRFGQLGIGNGMGLSQDTPILIGAIKKSKDNNKHRETFAWYDENIVQVAAGQYHSACISDKGSLYTWGWGIHGQLAHGTIYNEFTPKKVLALKSEKITYVGCGCCHTAMLTASGSVYLCGNSAFGQIGDSNRQKSNVPLRIDLGPNPVVLISVGYFHTLALTENNVLWTWGSSPQKLRLGARNAKMCKMRSNMSHETQDDSSIQMSTSPVPDDDFHLYPTKVDISNVSGKITAMAAGWHHSSIVDHFGNIYMWGLNLDCQLGTGDKNEVFIPTLVDVSRVKCDQTPVASTSQNIYTEDSPSRNNKFLPCVGCGGDFTVFVNFDGDVFATGNSFLQEANTSKSELRIVMFKNTKRIVRLPKPHTNLQKIFKYMPLLANFLYQLRPVSSEIPFEWPDNPIRSIKSFENREWASEVMGCLYEFVDDDTPLFDTHLRASLAIFRGDFVEGLSLQLNNLIAEKPEIMPEVCNKQYLKHNPLENKENLEKAKLLLKSKINSLSREWLSVPHENVSLDEISCLCDESKYLCDAKHENKSVVDVNIMNGAISLTRSILKILIDSGCTSWSECISVITKFWVNNGLDILELENIFLQNTSGPEAKYLGITIFCSTDNVTYQNTFSTSYKLKLCNRFLQLIN